jgi:uncharacterized protein (UPF0335 family)
VEIGRVSEVAEIEPIEQVEGEDVVDGMPAADQLRLFVERIERINEELADIQADRKDVFAEAKANGFDLVALRAVIRRRKLEPHIRQEQDAILDTYEIALGQVPGGMVDGGELGAGRLALPAPQPKIAESGAKKKAVQEALAWAGVGE